MRRPSHGLSLLFSASLSALEDTGLSVWRADRCPANVRGWVSAPCLPAE